MKRDNYNTKQKDLILDVIMNYDGKFTIKDIYNNVKDSTGLTTIYRLVDKLVLDGVIDRFIDSDGTNYYIYMGTCDEENHFYLKCDNCGKVEHIDCDCIKDLTSHINKKHNFKPNKDHIIISGLCNSCNGGK